MFFNAATEIRNVAVNKSPPKGLGNGIKIAISTTGAVGAGVAAAVWPGASAGAKVGQLAAKAVDLIIQVYCPFFTSDNLCQKTFKIWKYFLEKYSCHDATFPLSFPV